MRTFSGNSRKVRRKAPGKGDHALFNHFVVGGFAAVEPAGTQWGYWGAMPTGYSDPATCQNVSSFPTVVGDEPMAYLVKYCPQYKGLTDSLYLTSQN